MTSLDEAVRSAVGTVVDPCSRYIGSNLGLAELGMIDRVEVSPSGEVSITLLLDDPTCFYIVEIEHALRTAALSVPGVQDVEISIRWDELWTEERATEGARARLTGRMATRTPLVPLPTLRTGDER